MTIIVLFIKTFGFSQEGLELSRQDSAQIIELLTASKHFDSIDNLKESTRCLNAVALLYWNHNQYTNSTKHYKESLIRNQKLGNENAIAMINNNLGAIYADQGNFKESEVCFRITLKHRRTQKDQTESLTACLINLSQILLKTKKYEESAEFMYEAITYAKGVNDLERIVSCYGTLAEIFAQKGDKAKEQEYFMEYAKYNDIVRKQVQQKYIDEKDRAKLIEFEKLKKENELLIKAKELVATEDKLDKTESKFEMMKDVSKDLLENLNKEQLKSKILENEARISEMEAHEKADKYRNTILFFLISLIFLAVISLIIYRSYRRKKLTNKELAAKNIEIEKQNEEIKASRDQLDTAYKIIEQKNERITKSIDYAWMIQTAMLPDKDTLCNLVSDSFIYFKPRDIVSGDFYWYKYKDNKLIIAAIDCTGHGIPGALLSMIGNDLLNRIVLHDNITQPDKILKELDKGVINSLNQKESELSDGMDIAICVIDKQNKRLQFSGANNPLILIQKNELKRVRGNFFPVGLDELNKNEKIFTLHEFDISSETYFYIFSDGYTDQNRSGDFVKLGMKRFEDLLLGIYKKPFAEQKTIIEKTHESWRADGEQLDDIVVIGVKI